MRSDAFGGQVFSGGVLAAAPETVVGTRRSAVTLVVRAHTVYVAVTHLTSETCTHNGYASRLAAAVVHRGAQ